MDIKKVLTIAGSDTSGGAGIQADLKTFQERGVYGMTALTTVVAQNPHNNWSHEVFPFPVETVKTQLTTVLEGIGVDAVKTGMLGSEHVVNLAAEVIEKYNIPIVVIDPVMVCKGTDEVLHPETATALREALVPKATIVTPNLFEAGQLSNVKNIKTLDDMKEAAQRIFDLGPKNVLIKGGKLLESNQAVDLFYDGHSFEVLEMERIDTTYTHGAGCTFAATVTAELAKGKTVLEAVQIAKEFVATAIRSGFPLNQYVGPLNHVATKQLALV